MKKLFFRFVILVVLSASFACSKTGQEKIIVNVPVEFIFQPIELLSPQGNRLALAVRTVENQKCSGTRIGTTLSKNGSYFNISIQKTIPPSVCDNKAAFATDTLTLDVENDRVYNFNINLKELITNSGELTIDAQKVIINMIKKEEGISIENRELKRIQEKMVWGAVGFDQGQENKVNEFLLKLKKISYAEPIQSGDYGHFQYLGDVVTIKNNLNFKKSQSTKIVQRLNVNYSELEKLVKEYINFGLEVKFFTAIGTTI